MNQETAKNRTKVMFVVTKSNFGGAQRYVFDLATNLPTNGYDVLVATGSAQGSESAGSLIGMLQHAGIRTVFLPHMARDISPLRDWRTFLSLWKLMRDEKPDVVHLNSSKAGILGALTARLAGVRRIIFTAHGWAFWETRNFFSRALIYIISLKTILLSHQTICITRFDARAFDRISVARKKIVLIRNAARSPDGLLTRDAARSQLAPDAAKHAGAVWVGSVGELTYNKNIRTALDAIARARRSQSNLFYVVIGDGEQRESLIRYSKKLGLEGHVRFVGFVPNAPSILSAFDVLLIPSRKEGLPYVALEASNVPLAVLSSTVGGLPELIENGVCGALCAPDDLDCFSDALGELASDASLRTRLGNALKAKATREFNFEKMLQDTCALY